MTAADIIQARIDKRIATRGEYRALDRYQRRGSHPGAEFVLTYHLMVGSITRSLRPLLRAWERHA